MRVAIVGASRGIGFELCKLFTARGDDVIAVCRRASAELAAAAARIIDGVDLTTDAGIARLTSALAGTKLDVVIVAAGVLGRVVLEPLDVAALRSQFEANAVGPLRVAAALLPNLDPGAKIAFLTSRMGSIGDNTSGGHYGYRMSKAALNMAARSLAIDLKDRRIAVVVLHPGFVRTDMTGGQGNLTAAESAKLLAARVDAMSLAQSGEFFHANGERLPW